MVDNIMSRTRTIEHGGHSLVFCVPNAQNRYRIDTFSTKEPETLEWIDSLPRGAVLWDIGANVGLYSCYAAARQGCRVFAFEPSVFNLELLARNIHLNGLTDRVTIVPLALSDSLAVSKLNLSNTEWGGALSTFGRAYGHDGHSLQKVFEFGTVGLSMLDAVEALRLPRPDYIKMDVDGIEHLILRGGQAVLTQIRGILVEINDGFDEQARGSALCLESAGLTLLAKRHSQMVEDSEFRNAFNQIWARKDSVSNAKNER
jgi:FkbM family methyltransferase